MIRYKVTDIIKTTRPDFIRLKNRAPKNPSALTVQDENRLNLRLASLSSQAKTRKHRPLWNSTRKKGLDTITSTKPKTNFHLTPQRNDRTKTSARYASALKITALGLVVVFVINLANVFAVGLDFSKRLVSQASAGLGSLESAVKKADQLSLTQAEIDFQEAEKTFEKTQEQLSFLQTSNQLASAKSLDSVNHLLTAAQDTAASGKLFSQSAQDLLSWPELFIQANRDQLLLNQQATKPATSLTAKLSDDLDKVSQAIEKLKSAQAHLIKVDPNSLPTGYQEKLIDSRAKLDQILIFLEEQKNYFPAVLKMLGHRYPQTYLVLLQNDTEARPTGGFIGSLMLVDINDGIITKAEFKDVYQFDGQLNEPIAAPEDIAEITDNWRLRDSNYSPDFAISAEKAAWFLQKSKGPSVDSVIAINQSLIADLIAELGPLNIPELKSELTSSNFQFLLSYLIESKYYGAENPKLILSKTIDAFKAKLLHTDHPEGLIKALAAGLKNQKILFYSREAEIQKMFESFNLTPHPHSPAADQDYLQVIATSIGGNKSDLFMSQKLNHLTYIDADGQVYDELTITRTHNFQPADLNRWNVLLKTFQLPGLSDDLANLLGRGDNLVSLKVYLPFGTEFVEASSTAGSQAPDISIRHDSELHKTYFLTRLETKSGQSSTITIRYKLPFKLTFLPADLYHLTVDPQIGLVPTRFEHQTLSNPGLVKLRNSFPEGEIALTDSLEALQVIAN
ncbi:DUF4012 domain-containing protein [Candidatus Peregrinibacteria bacterium]|nr:DUF4012 domain-containing protein [Candidatus Peregrinibacteria bacterium]